MASNFVPLQVKTGIPASSRGLRGADVQVLSGLAASKASTAFASLPSPPATAAPPPAHSGFNPLVQDKATCSPQVRVQKEGDRVSLIQIQCSCGQVIELACNY